MRKQMKKVFKLIVKVPCMMVAAPFYLVVYLYEKVLNRLWPDPYDRDDDDLK